MPPRATNLKDGDGALQSLWDIFDRCIDLWSEEGTKSHPKIPKEGQPGYALIQAWFDAGAVDGCIYNIGQVKRQFVLYRVQRRPELGANHNTREGESIIAAAADSYQSRLVLRVSSDAVATRAMVLLLASGLANATLDAPMHRHVINVLAPQIKTSICNLIDETLVPLMITCRPKSVKTRHEQERSFHTQRLHEAWEAGNATRRTAEAALLPEPPQRRDLAIALRLSAEASPATPFVERAAKMYSGDRKRRARSVSLLVLEMHAVAYRALCEHLTVKESVPVLPPNEDGPGGPYSLDDPVAAILYYIAGYVLVRMRLDATARRSEGKARVSKRATPEYVPFQLTWALRMSTLNKKQALAMGLPTTRVDERSSRQGHPAVYPTKEFFRYLCYLERMVSATLQLLAVVEQPSDVFKQLKVALVGNTVAIELLRGTYVRIGGTTVPDADKVNDEYLRLLHGEVLGKYLATRGRDYVRAVIQKMKNNSVKNVAFRAQVAVKNQSNSAPTHIAAAVQAEEGGDGDADADADLARDMIELIEEDAIEDGEGIADSSSPAPSADDDRSPPENRLAKRPRLSSFEVDHVCASSTAMTEEKRAEIAKKKEAAIALREAKARAKQQP